MSGPELGPWEPLTIPAIVDAFAGAPFRWWISGGLALDLHLGRSWREHGDADVGVIRKDLDAVHSQLSAWHVHVAADGQLSPWRGERLHADAHQKNLWCRLVPDGPWVLDITIGDGTEDEWIYRRDPTIRAPWDEAVLRGAGGVPYLAPELQLLFKSKGLRPKDDVDAAEVMPALDDGRRDFLRRVLGPDHPWQRHLA